MMGMDLHKLHTDTGRIWDCLVRIRLCESSDVYIDRTVLVRVGYLFQQKTY
jgi:hypothetical protein